MKISPNMLRQLASRSATRSVAARPFVSTGRSSVSFFCTSTPDMPLMGSNNNMNRASFSSKANLLDILKREHEEEIDLGNTAMPEDLSDLRRTIEASWKIVESGAATDLYNLRDDKVRVSFHCQDTLEVVEEEEEDHGDEDEEAPAAPVRFTVTVTKNGGKESLNFACFSEYGEVKIEGVSTTSASTPNYVHEHQGTLPKIEYQGPDFGDLAEDLQEGLLAYLDEECGINGDVAAFIAMSSDFREEINYVDFLNQAQSIVSS